MKIEPVTQENYKVLVEWWKSHGWDAIPFDILPKIGYIINDNVAGFLYSTDSTMAIMEWFISNPNSTKEERNENLNILINFLSEIAKDLGFKTCFTYTVNKGLINKLENNGFLKTDENMVHLVRRL